MTILIRVAIGFLSMLLLIALLVVNWGPTRSVLTVYNRTETSIVFASYRRDH